MARFTRAKTVRESTTGGVCGFAETLAGIYESREIHNSRPFNGSKNRPHWQITFFFRTLLRPINQFRKRVSFQSIIIPPVPTWFPSLSRYFTKKTQMSAILISIENDHLHQQWYSTWKSMPVRREFHPLFQRSSSWISSENVLEIQSEVGWWIQFNWNLREGLWKFISEFQVVDHLNNKQCHSNNVSRIAICLPLNYPLALFHPHFNTAFQSGVINQSLHKLRAGNRFVIDAILAHTKNPKIFSPNPSNFQHLTRNGSRARDQQSKKFPVPKYYTRWFTNERTCFARFRCCCCRCSLIQNLFRFLLDRQPGVYNTENFASSIKISGYDGLRVSPAPPPPPSSQSRKLSSGK